MAPVEQSMRFLEFYKPYIRKYSLHQMKIPDAFVRQFKVVPSKATLQNYMGKVWHLKMGSTDGSVCFMDGWQKFIADNSVVHGDLLVFLYDGGHAFKVKIFAMSGVEKRENGAMKGCDTADIKEENEEEDEGKEEEDGEIFIDDEDDGGSDDTENCNEEEEMDDGDIEEEEEEEAYKAPTIKKHKGKKISGNNGGTMTRATGRRARFHDDLKKSEVRKYVKSQNPYFVARTIQRKKDLLFVPSYVMKEFGLELPKKVTFHDELGGKWPGEVLRWKDGRTLIRGWNAVCRWNHVEKDDKCICEFVGGKGRKGAIIVVHILRGVGSSS